MATIRLTNDAANLLMREILALDQRYHKKLFNRRDRKRRLPPLRDALCLFKPHPK